MNRLYFLDRLINDQSNLSLSVLSDCMKMIKSAEPQLVNGLKFKRLVESLEDGALIMLQPVENHPVIRLNDKVLENSKKPVPVEWEQCPTGWPEK